jgi:hypothetical protein
MLPLTYCRKTVVKGKPGGWQYICVIIPTSTYEAFRVLKSHKSSRSRIIDRTSIGISVFHLETNFVVSVVYIIHAEGLHLIQILGQAKLPRLREHQDDI